MRAINTPYKHGCRGSCCCRRMRTRQNGCYPWGPSSYSMDIDRCDHLSVGTAPLSTPLNSPTPMYRDGAPQPQMQLTSSILPRSNGSLTLPSELQDELGEPPRKQQGRYAVQPPGQLDVTLVDQISEMPLTSKSRTSPAIAAVPESPHAVSQTKYL